MDREAAKSLATEALSFLARDLERIGGFLALTGTNPKEIRALAGDPAFLVAVLDHVLSDQSGLQAFADETGCSPADLEAARTALGGRPWERDVP